MPLKRHRQLDWGLILLIDKQIKLLIILIFAFACGGKRGDSTSQSDPTESDPDSLPSSPSVPWEEPYSNAIEPESALPKLENAGKSKPATLPQPPPLVQPPPLLPPVLEIVSPVNNLETTQANQLITGVCETGLEISVSYISGFLGPSSIACNEGLFIFEVIITGVNGTIVNRSLTLKQSFNSSRSTSRSLNYRFGSIDAPTKVSMDGPRGVEAGSCVPFNVISRNLFNYPSPVQSDEVVQFAVNNGTGQFYSDNLCTSMIYSSALLEGQQSTTVYFSSTTNPQDLTILLTATSLSQGTFILAVGGESSSLILEASPLFETNQCGQAIVRRVDAFGVAIADDSTVTVDLVQNGNLNFYSDDSCSNAMSNVEIFAFSDSASFYFTSSLVETVSISAIDHASVLAAANLDIRFELTKSSSRWRSCLKGL